MNLKTIVLFLAFSFAAQAQIVVYQVQHHWREGSKNNDEAKQQVIGRLADGTMARADWIPAYPEYQGYPPRRTIQHPDGYTVILFDPDKLKETTIDQVFDLGASPKNNCLSGANKKLIEIESLLGQPAAHVQEIDKGADGSTVTRDWWYLMKAGCMEAQYKTRDYASDGTLTVSLEILAKATDTQAAWLFDEGDGYTEGSPYEHEQMFVTRLYGSVEKAPECVQTAIKQQKEHEEGYRKLHARAMEIKTRNVTKPSR